MDNREPARARTPTRTRAVRHEPLPGTRRPARTAPLLPALLPALLGMTAACADAGTGSAPPDNRSDATFTDCPVTLATDGCADCTRLVGGTVFTGMRAGRGDVILRGAQVVCVTLGGNGPEVGTAVDVSGKTVMPGLVDAHVHTHVYAGPSGFDPGGDAAWNQVRAMLHAGVTSYLDTGSPLADIMDKRARSVGAGFPRVFAAGPMFTATRGHPCVGGPNPACQEVNSPMEVAAALPGVLMAQPDMIKGVVEPGLGVLALPTLDMDTMRALVDGAAAAGVPVLMHASVTEHMMQMAGVGVKRFAHLPLQDTMTTADATELANGGVMVVPTLAQVDALYRMSLGQFTEVNDAVLAETVDVTVLAELASEGFVDSVTSARSRATMAEAWENITQNFVVCRNAGVRLVAGTDAGNPGVFHGWSLARELSLYVAFGMTPQEALVTATVNAADFLGRPDLGRLEPGARADVLVVEGNALEDIFRVRQVARIYKDGERVNRALLLP